LKWINWEFSNVSLSYSVSTINEETWKIYFKFWIAPNDDTSSYGFSIHFTCHIWNMREVLVWCREKLVFFIAVFHVLGLFMAKKHDLSDKNFFVCHAPLPLHTSYSEFGNLESLGYLPYKFRLRKEKSLSLVKKISP
jgi:hypothetical protein